MADTSTPSNPPGPSRSPVLIVVVIVAIAAMVGLNIMSAGFRPKSDEELQKEAQEAAAKQASPSPAASGAPGAEAGGPTDLSLLSPSGVIGNPSDNHQLTVGFAWTPQVQADPTLVTKAIDTLHKVLPTGGIHVVNADAEPGTPLGISVNGKVVIPAAADGSISLPEPAVGQVMSAFAAGGNPVLGVPISTPPASAAPPQKAQKK